MNAQQRAVYQQHHAMFSGHAFRHAAITPANTNATTQFREPFLSQALIYVVTETVGDYPYPYFTEKTWKAIANQRAFIIIGAQNSLQQLRTFGFQTFGAWWDESYDQLPHVADRIEHVVGTLSKMKSMTHLELEQIEIDMLDVLRYNTRHLQTFIKQDLSNIDRSI